MSEISEAARELAKDLRDRASKELIVRSYLADQATQAADALESKDRLISGLKEWMETKAVHHYTCRIQSGSDDCTCGLHDLISKANLIQG